MRSLAFGTLLAMIAATNGLAADLVQLVVDGRVPGLSLAIVRDGKLAGAVAVGVRNISSGAPVDDHTIFDAASLSKPVFAYGVLQLIDAGALSFETRLSTYVSDYVRDDPRAESVTVAEVLSHTSGLPNWRSDKLPLKTYFSPGARFSYSGEGYIWLQRVVEKITGEGLETTMRRLVFVPLGMTESSYVWQPRFDADYADPHDAALVPGAKRKPTDAGAAYSLQTTAVDYARFVQAVLEDARLKRSTARRWLEPQVPLRQQCIQCVADDLPAADVRVAWGLGWGLEPDAATFFHWGDNDRGRFKAFVMGSVRERTAVVVFTNGFGGMSIMPDLIEAFMPGEHAAFSWLGYPRWDAASR
jgi:CubicO group peptidase (beta-lactamase class C family)